MNQLVHASVSPAFLISAQENFAKRTQFAIPFAQAAFPANESSQSAGSADARVRALSPSIHELQGEIGFVLQICFERSCCEHESRPTEGSRWLGGRLSQRRAQIGFVLQISLGLKSERPVSPTRALTGS